MPRRWTKEEERIYRKELLDLYVTQNKSIGEIAPLLGIAEASVFDRMQRLNIKTIKHLKPRYLNKRIDVMLPEKSESLAEFLGIMLGDGHISHFQTIVTLGTKELAYVQYVKSLMQELFYVPASISIKKLGYRDVYIGSTEITKWLRAQGLVQHKVASQVDVPAWILSKRSYMTAFVRGFFDTDGSIYKLRFGIQISLTNKSLPLLQTLRNMLIRLGYKTSEVSSYRVYVTRRSEVIRFFNQVRPANTKHLRRFEHFMRRSDSGYSRRL